MQGLFDMSSNSEDTTGADNLNMGAVPNANDIQDHITGMLEGKLGKLAKEIAEETAEGLNIDMETELDWVYWLQNS